jgi:MFS transporter, PAT family, beta-lactamase induction signal transducer AmpG
MVQPYLIGQLHYSPAEVGTVNQGVGLAATIGGALAGGVLTGRLGVRRALLLFGTLQCVSNLLYLALPAANRPALVAVIVADNLCTGLATAAFVTFLMSLCSKAYSATQYAILSSLAGLAGRLLTVSAGVVAQEIGWPELFVGTVAISLPALVLLWVHGGRDQ